MKEEPTKEEIEAQAGTLAQRVMNAPPMSKKQFDRIRASRAAAAEQPAPAPTGEASKA